LAHPLHSPDTQDLFPGWRFQGTERQQRKTGLRSAGYHTGLIRNCIIPSWRCMFYRWNERMPSMKFFDRWELTLARWMMLNKLMLKTVII